MQISASETCPMCGAPRALSDKTCGSCGETNGTGSPDRVRARSGKVILLICFAMILAVDMFIVAGKIAANEAIQIDVARLLLTAALLFFVWMGHRWALILIVLLLAGVGLLGIAMSVGLANGLLFGIGLL